MDQTPAHEAHNPDLLELLPPGLERIVEVGSSSGALAREYKRANPDCRYVGIEIDARYAELSRRHCDEVLHADVEGMEGASFARLFPSDAWVFGDSLEHLRDPWSVLWRLRRHFAPGCVVVACVPNAQHWSIQARLNSGLFRYEAAGLLDRTHLRWFTRKTLVELFESSGFAIDDLYGRVFEEPGRDGALAGVRALAAALGVDAQEAANDATPLQWVLRARVR